MYSDALTHRPEMTLNDKRTVLIEHVCPFLDLVGVHVHVERLERWDDIVCGDLASTFFVELIEHLLRRYAKCYTRIYTSFIIVQIRVCILSIQVS